MKVLCIKEDTKTISGPPTPTQLKVGEIYTVIDTKIYNGSTFYMLNEIESNMYGAPIFFNSRNFMPLSEIDETELVKERETVYA